MAPVLAPELPRELATTEPGARRLELEARGRQRAVVGLESDQRIGTM